MIAEQLNAIKERVAKATHGPWGMASDGSIHSKATHGYVLYTPTKNAEIIATRVDFDFLLNAREDVPALVAEVERLQNRCELHEVARRNDVKMIEHKDAEIERLRKALEFYANQFNYAFEAKDIRVDYGHIAREALAFGEESNAL